MDTKFVAFFIAFICVLAANNSEGKRKLGENNLDNEVQVIDKHTAAQIWNYCQKELKDSTEAVKGLDLSLSHSRSVSHNGVEFDSTLSAKRIIQKAIADLPPKKKETLLHCLREKSFPLQLLKDEEGTLSNECQNLFSGWASIPRRYLRHKRGKRRVLKTDSALLLIHQVTALGLSPVPTSPASAPQPSGEPTDKDYPSALDSTDYPSPSNIIYHTPGTERVLPIPSKEDNRKFLIAGVVASLLAGFGIIAIILLLCVKKDREVEPNDGQRDEKPLLNFSTSSISAGSSERSHVMGISSSMDLKAPPTNGSSSLDAISVISQAASQSKEADAETVGKTALPLPPGRTATAAAAAAGAAALAAKAAAAAAGEAAAPPPPSGPPPPPPPRPAAPAPPPPPRGGRRPPPNPPLPARPSPLGPLPRRNSSGETSEASDEAEAPKTKLKPFFWDKVLASPDHSMVWHEIKAGSFQFNEEMMEALFGYTTADKKKHEHRRDSSSDSTPQFIQIIDPKKSQNLAILLKALNVTTEEVCGALKEGNELPAEFIQTLLKMAPTTDEELKLRLYTGDLAHLSPADRFLKVVVDIPFAFKRLESLLFLSTFQEEFSSIKDSLATLEVACKELRNSRLFLKLLEAVLKTGNRMNDGTYRGGAQAFKLDTLLKLSDVKGTDGKTTLLHFVVHEIIRGEGLRAARKLRESRSMSSVKTEDLLEDSSHETEEFHRHLGLQEVAGLSNELLNVKKAALIDNDILSESVSKLSQARVRAKDFLETEMKGIEEESEFLDTLTSFLNQSESDITWLIEEEKRIMALVKSTGDYFHGRAGRDEGAHLFVIVRDFLLMVDKACLDVKNSFKLPTKTQRKDASTSSPSPSQSPAQESTLEMHRRLFPAMRERQIDDDDDDEFSSDDDS